MKESTTIKVDKEIINKFTILSVKTNQKRHELIKEALTLYLKQNEKKGNDINDSDISSIN